MKKMSLKFIFVSMGAMMAVACGKFEQDPTKDYPELKSDVPPYHISYGAKQTVKSLYFIDRHDHMTFVQGEERVVKFSVRLAFSNPDQVKYTLKVKEATWAPYFQKSKVEPHVWEFRWKPSSNILNFSEKEKKLPMTLEFVLLPGNTPEIANQFALVDPLHSEDAGGKLEVTLVKSKDQPVILDNSITFHPGAEINPDQSARIQFQVAAKGLDKPESLLVRLLHGPAEPSLELPQMDAIEGIGSIKPKLVRTVGFDKEGRQIFLYEVTFKARPFLDAFLAKLKSNPRLYPKYLDGRLTAAEAVFIIGAFNRYNNEPSAEHTVMIKVRTTEKPGDIFIAGMERVAVKAGAEAAENFNLVSSDARSAVSVVSVNVGDEELKFKNGVVEINNDEINLTLSCGTGTPNLNRHYGCVRGGCYQACRVRVEAPCESKNKTLNLKINAESRMGAEVLNQTLLYTAQVRGQLKACVQAGGQKK